MQSTNNLALFSFYKDILELPVTQYGKGIAISARETKLIFDETQQSENPFYHFAFNIPSNKFDEACHWVKQRVEFMWLEDYNGFIADFVNWNAKSFYFKDPSGNILEMISRLDLHVTVDEAFSSGQIINISEIGIVFPAKTFNEDINALMKNFSLNYFDKQQPLPHFRVIGNDEGLFIAVPENRFWFATENRAKIFHAEIEFINKNKLYNLTLP